MTGPAPANRPGGDGPRLTIERLRMRAAGLDEGAARQLATLVGQGLAPSLALPVGTTALDTLRIEVAAHTGDDVALLSRRIIDAIGRALARDRAPIGARAPATEEGAP